MIPPAVADYLPARFRLKHATAPTPRIAILGAGVGGLCMGIQLRRAGVESFTIYEKSDGVGGTWRDNSYPGAACDVPSHFYSFSFAPNPRWSRVFPGQEEILTYLERCTDRYGLRPHLRLNAEVTDARWDDEANVWRLTTRAGEEIEADVLVSGLGQLNVPAYPDIPGLDTFEGTKFHSARWDHSHDLAGDRIAVIGNGASAVQFVPEIVEAAAHTTVFQRSANWLLPRPDGPYPETAQDAFERVPLLRRAHRAQIWAALELRWWMIREGSSRAEKTKAMASDYLEAAVADPELRAKLTPDYPIGCKRVLIASDYYPALVRDDVTVVTAPITEIVPDGLITADGTHHAVDTIIFGTGFQSTKFLGPVDVVGRGGERLHDRWRDGAEAYLGVAVHGFPNLFMLYGPNTNLGTNSIMFMIECQVEYILRAVAAMQRDATPVLDVRATAMERYNRGIQEAMHKTVWQDGCSSWYKTASGKVTNNWPQPACAYWLRVHTTALAAFDRDPESARASEVPTPEVPTPEVPTPEEQRVG